LTQPAAALRELGEVVWTSAPNRFETETALDGSKWVQNSDLTPMRYF
jgi:hypothetical protein